MCHHDGVSCSLSRVRSLERVQIRVIKREISRAWNAASTEESLCLWWVPVGSQPMLLVPCSEQKDSNLDLFKALKLKATHLRCPECIFQPPNASFSFQDYSITPGGWSVFMCQRRVNDSSTLLGQRRTACVTFDSNGPTATFGGSNINQK